MREVLCKKFFVGYFQAESMESSTLSRIISYLDYEFIAKVFEFASLLVNLFLFSFFFVK